MCPARGPLVQLWQCVSTRTSVSMSHPYAEPGDCCGIHAIDAVCNCVEVIYLQVIFVTAPQLIFVDAVVRNIAASYDGENVETHQIHHGS